MGAQRRSSTVYHDLKARIDAGELGDLYQADSWYTNQRKSIGKGARVAAPPELDWDLWQGPAVRQPYKEVLVHYDWHWTWRYGTGEVGNNAVHELDVARWMLGVDYPEQVSAIGGRRFFRGDDWEMYDTLDLHYGFADGRVIRWAGHSCNRQAIQQRGRGVQLFGTRGSAIIGQDGYELFDAGGKLMGSQSMPDPAPLERLAAYDLLHAANFADAVRGTARASAPAADANISTTLSHLGNIAWRSGGMIRTDPATGRPRDAAAMRLWRTDYADGWAIG
jgi:predicted dehydrogenase